MTATTSANGRPVLECSALHKHFGGVVAVNAVDLEVRRGEVLAIVGDNGAGKSTFIKMLCGALKPDGGEIVYDGETVKFDGPLDARLRGIETVFQELALIPTMDVAQNLFLGREIVRRPAGLPIGFLRRRRMIRQATEHLGVLGVSVPATHGLAVDRLSGGQRQGIAIARALTWASGVLIMDEPTAALGVRQSEAVLKLARRAAEHGCAVILITHTLPYVMRFADRIVVFRRGEKVGDLAVSDASPDQLVSLIVGLDQRSSVSSIVESQWSSGRGSASRNADQVSNAQERGSSDE